MTKIQTKLQKLPLEKISTGSRFRRDLELDEDFLLSIAEKGIFQPITVSYPDEKGIHTLIAGGRRFAAAKKLKLPQIPALVRKIEDELDLREIELMENLQRKDMRWSDEVDLTAQIHRLMVEKHGEKKWSQRKTAKMLDRSVGGINRRLDLAKRMEQLPDLRNEQTEDAAVRKLRQLVEAVAVKTLSKSHQNRERPEQADDGETEELEEADDPRRDPFLSRALNAEHHYRAGNAIDELRSMIEEKLTPPISFVEVDPPYAINLRQQKKGDMSVELSRYEEIPADSYPAFLENFCTVLHAALPKDSRVIFWFGIEWYSTVREVLTRVGFTVDPIPCVWTKAAGQTNNPELFLARAWEPFFVAWKGDGVPIRKRGRSNVFNYAVVPHTDKYHPTQRPLDLMLEIVRTFAWPGTLALVPFLGSGVTLRAMYAEGITGFGWDLNEANKEPFIAAVEKDIGKYLKEEEE